MAAVVAAAAVATAVAASLAATSGSGPPAPPPSSVGLAQARAVPAAIADLPLRNQSGHRVTLSRYRGRAVLLVPFLTSCQEECPITTGALLGIEHALRRDGSGRDVVVVEATVDPRRDTPARLAAYARYTGTEWPLLTGSAPALDRLWRYFGIYHRRVAEGSPPGVDWETGRPYTYDVDHSDGFVLLGPGQRERFLAGGMANVSGIPRRLRALLDREGLGNLRHPGGGSWTIAEALQAIGWVLGRDLPVHG